MLTWLKSTMKRSCIRVCISSDLKSFLHCFKVIASAMGVLSVIIRTFANISKESFIFSLKKTFKISFFFTITSTMAFYSSHTYFCKSFTTVDHPWTSPLRLSSTGVAAQISIIAPKKLLNKSNELNCIVEEYLRFHINAQYFKCSLTYVCHTDGWGLRYLWYEQRLKILDLYSLFMWWSIQGYYDNDHADRICFCNNPNRTHT